MQSENGTVACFNANCAVEIIYKCIFHQVAKLSGGENYAVLHSYSFVLGIRFSRIVRICHTIMSFGHI